MEAWKINTDVLTKETKALTKDGENELQRIGGRFRTLAANSPIIDDLLNDIDQIVRMTKKEKLNLLNIILPEVAQDTQLTIIKNILEALNYPILTEQQKLESFNQIRQLHLAATDTDDQKARNLETILQILRYPNLTSDVKSVKLSYIIQQFADTYGQLSNSQISAKLEQIVTIAKDSISELRFAALRSLVHRHAFTKLSQEKQLTKVNEVLGRLGYKTQIDGKTTTVGQLCGILEADQNSSLSTILPSPETLVKAQLQSKVEEIIPILPTFLYEKSNLESSIMDKILAKLQYPVYIDQDGAKKVQKINDILEMLHKSPLTDVQHMDEILRILGYKDFSEDWVALEMLAEIMNIMNYPTTETQKIETIDNILNLLEFPILLEETKFEKLRQIMSEKDYPLQVILKFSILIINNF